MVTGVRAVKRLFQKLADTQSLDLAAQTDHIITTTPGPLMSIPAPGRSSPALAISPYPARDMLLRWSTMLFLSLVVVALMARTLGIWLLSGYLVGHLANEHEGTVSDSVLQTSGGEWFRRWVQHRMSDIDRR